MISARCFWAPPWKASSIAVTVSLADAARDAGKPFAILGMDAALKGQGAPLGWNPYVVGARFVLHRVEGEASLDALADQIVAKIVQSRAELISQDQGNGQ